MAYILLDSLYQFNAITNADKKDTTNIVESGWVNSPVELQYDIWSKDAPTYEYTIKCTNDERWILDNYLMGHIQILLFDSKRNHYVEVWLESIKEEWTFEKDTPWILSVTFIEVADDLG